MNNYNNLIYNDDYNRINDITKNKKGINNQINENEIISNYKLVNIDSRNRLKTSKNIISKTITCSNSLCFIKNKNNITFNIANHGLKEGNKITINNVSNTNVNLNEDNIIFENNSDVLHFNLNSNFVISDIYTTQYLYIYDIKYHSTNIGNININLLYGIHKIIIINDTDIAIKLPYIYNNNNNNNNNLNISFKLLNLCGIPLNEINSNYPLDNDRLTGFKNIVNVTTNSFDILSTTKAVNNLTNVGGNNIRIGLISNTIKGYDNSNNYKIEIPIINNVKQISIISSDIPHTQYNINNNNNLLYINFIFNSSNTKSIELLPGYYNTSTLISNIEEKINNIDIIYNLNKNISDNNKDIEFISLESKVSLDSYKDIIKFIIYINLKFINNIFYLSENNNNLLKINHYNHNLDVGDFILISESLSINKIPSNIINQEHQIFKIIDNNNYLIKLPEYIELSNIETNLINIINIKYKLKFRLEFDKKNTFGNLLGFRNIEDKNSITHYHTEISNTTPYINELKLDSNNNINIMQNNRINLNPINYIFLSCNLYYTGR